MSYVERFHEELTKSKWPPIAMMVVGNAGLSVAAWRGESWAIIALFAFNSATAVLLGLNQILVRDTLALSAGTLDDFKRENDFTQALTSNLLEALSRLNEHDPTAAEVLQDRFAEAVKVRYPEYTAERSRHAEMN
jgi:hypothetical protein